MTRFARTGSYVALATVGALALAGCKFQGAASFPLPGGVGGNGYQVKVDFKDALDLVPQSSVKVNDVTVGSVKKIDLAPNGYTAVVTVAIKNDVKLPSNVTARLRQTSLLGEKFVSIEAPDKAQWVGELKAGAEITDTAENADVEEVLGALSLVLNGGGLEQLKIINSELTKALKGRETEVRDFLTQLTGFVTGLDAQKVQITNALDGLDRLTAKLAASRTTIDVALRDIPKGVAVLADERTQITKVLAGLNNLGTVATRVIQGTQQNTIADLKSLQPILFQLGAAGKDLPNALELLTTYPFPKTVALPGGKGGIRGDYANLFVTIDGDPSTLLNSLLSSTPLGGIVPPIPPLPVVPKLPLVPKVPVVPNRPPLLPGLGSLLGTQASGSSDLSRLLFGGLS
jgi:phospholipid/cholesterol/gamma-HCH transport system substrate-binding protein